MLLREQDSSNLCVRKMRRKENIRMPVSGRTLQPLVIVVLAGARVACAGDPYQRTKVGPAVGAAAGAAAGYAVDGGAKGALIGAAIGALGGGAVGNYMDRQQREFEQALAAEQARHEIEIERLKDDVLKLDLSS